MTVFLLVLLIPLAFGCALWWRRRIDRTHNAFQTKMDLAGDEDHARQLLQRHYNKQGGTGIQPGNSADSQDEMRE